MYQWFCTLVFIFSCRRLIGSGVWECDFMVWDMAHTCLSHGWGPLSISSHALNRSRSLGNTQFAWHLWGLMICIPSTWDMGAKIVHVYVQLCLLVWVSTRSISSTFWKEEELSYKYPSFLWLYSFLNGSLAVAPVCKPLILKQFIWTLSLGCMKASPQWLWLCYAHSAHFCWRQQEIWSTCILEGLATLAWLSCALEEFT